MAKRRGENEGLGLHDAALRFAPSRLRRRVGALQTEDGPVTQLAKAQKERLGEQASPGWDAFAEAGRSLDQMTANAKALSDIYDALLAKLIAGKLIATGFPIHREGAAEREVVPEFMFQAQFAKWSKSVLKGLNRHYEMVLVFEPELQSQHDPGATSPISSGARPTKSPKPKRPVGRPNIRDVIRDLAIEILSADKPPKWRFKKDLYPIIRQIGSDRQLEGFSTDAPQEEVMRIGVTEAFKLRPDLNGAHKL